MLLQIPVISFLTDKITLNHQNMTFYHFGIYAFFKMAAIPAILDFRVGSTSENVCNDLSYHHAKFYAFITF